ncbi:GrpE protein 1, mitochondrial [Cyanidiococcus yangmingshanensis]|uniref:GrpE protein 1, mitochondrial n=1 Tax=Cyanidiococcus yangmingshanensis TaxID=2690220 RepID=A0A7J7ILI2_9RHOD|nr:GrpE protein 1, mitochondrial [Cyanidiococcus yangmingshanensis]
MLVPLARVTRGVASGFGVTGSQWRPCSKRRFESVCSLRYNQRHCLSSESKDASEKDEAGEATTASSGSTSGIKSACSNAAEQATTNQTESGREAGGTSTALKVDGRVQQLEQLLQERDNELTTMRERVIRLLAEMENVRMIARRDVEMARKYSIASFAKELLDVADNLGRALAAVPPEQLAATQSSGGALSDPVPQQGESTKSASMLRALYEGVSATERELQRALQKFGIQRYGQVGEPFNPEVHQAVFEAPAPARETSSDSQRGDEEQPAALPDGVILHVLKAGYRIHDRVLRPAEVGVVKNVSSSASNSS